jgi:hypothetical protein
MCEAMRPNLIYQTSEYLAFLIDLLSCENETIKFSDSEIGETTLPLLVKDGPRGRVANSLPFFGSHGGPFSLDGSRGGCGKALQILEDRIKQSDYSSVTVIENPFQPITTEYEEPLRFLRAVDTRISQVTHWNIEVVATEKTLLEKFHQKTRNSVRKGVSRIGTVRDCSRDDEVFAFLASEHQESIVRLGGIPKSTKVFDLLRKHFSDALRLYGAYTPEGDLASALLTLEFESTVEYFTPVVKPEFKESQVLSGLIFSVMLDKFQNGFAHWNWGGTWESQQGVHRFKSRFGAVDRPYRYFNWTNSKIAECSSKELLIDYPYWFTRKFD